MYSGDISDRRKGIELFRKEWEGSGIDNLIVRNLVREREVHTIKHVDTERVGHKRLVFPSTERHCIFTNAP